jgi:hypothetical protein
LSKATGNNVARPNWPLTVAVLLIALVSSPHQGHTQSGYEVVVAFDPIGEPPDASWLHLYPWYGVVRGLDGRLYGIKADGDYYVSKIFAVDPAAATPAEVVLHALRGFAPYLSPFFIGRGGWLYFTINDDNSFCEDGDGCIARVHSQTGQLQFVYGLREDSPGGHDPWYGAIEGADDHLYCWASKRAGDGHCREVRPGNWDTLFKVKDGVVTVLQREWCLDDPPYGLIQGSDGWWYDSRNPAYPVCTPDRSSCGLPGRMMSDGRFYYAAGDTITSYDRYTGTTSLIVRIASTDGRPNSILAEHDGYLYGTTTSGGALGGGVLFRVRVPSLSTVDLVERAVSDPPAFVAPGGAFVVTDTVQNRGSGLGGTSKTRYYLSPDVIHDDTDIPLTGGRYVPELSGGAYSMGTKTVKVPDTTPPGSYRLLACADAAIDIVEFAEENNCIAAGTTVTVGRPDLVQTSVSEPPAEAVPGSKFRVTDTVHNASVVTASAFAIRYYVSSDRIKGGADTLLTGKRSVLELTSGASSSGTATVTIPLGLPLAHYYLLACADDLARIKETNEDNNCAASAGTMLVGWPDLVTLAAGPPPPSLIAGSQFYMTDTAHNQGSLTAASSYTRYYLSTDLLKNAGDVLLTGKRTVTSLAPGASSDGGKKLTVPLGTPAGTYYVLACADDLQKVAESDNANNCLASGGTVIISP